MAVRITGLNSGLDTDAIVQELVKSYSGQKENIEKKQTKLEWKQDAWKELNTKIYNFYSSQLSNLRLTSAYNAKTANVSDTTKATVKANNSATIGTQTLEITQTAQAGYLTGARIKTNSGAAATSQTALSELGLNKATTLSVEVGGTTKKIDVSSSDTIQNVVEKFRKAGLNASFDANSQRLFISSKESGEAGNFKLTADNYSSLAGSELKVDGEYATRMTTAGELGISGSVDLYIKVNGKNEKVTINEDDEIFKIVGKFESMGIKASFNDDTHKLILTQDSGADVEFQPQVNTSQAKDAFGKLGLLTPSQGGEAYRYTAMGHDALGALGLLTEEPEPKKVSTLTGSAVKTEGGDLANRNTKVSELGIPGLDSDDDTLGLKVKVNGEVQTITIQGDDEIFKVLGRFEAKGLKADFDQKTGSIILSQEGYSDVDFELQLDDESSKEAFKKLGLLTADQGGEAVRTEEVIGSNVEKAVKVDGQDAKIKLNGAEFTSKDGNFSINGLSISALEKTSGAISINTTVDSQGIYDSIKGFFKEYNELMKEMDTLYNADNAKGYEPLTDDEKDKLTDTEVEKWEKKIKDSLLRRDSTLSSVAETLRTAMAKSYTINGKSYSLSNFGIKTQSYLAAGKNEKSLYHIDGDSDDSLTKTRDDKLMAAISSDPEGVADFFSQLVKGAYQALDKKMRSSTLSSAYVVYNDKQITNELKEYKSKITDWEDKVKYYEDFYYKKFSAMEKAMANLQSSQNSLSMLLGQ